MPGALYRTDCEDDSRRPNLTLQVSLQDFLSAIAGLRPSVAATSVDRFEAWNRSYGSS